VTRSGISIETLSNKAEFGIFVGMSPAVWGIELTEKVRFQFQLTEISLR